MCNMAAYAGKHRAAPILFEMLEEQECLGGGHYNGIATIHEGKIYYAKVCGPCSKLRETTNALDLPGTVGIAHSRTPGIDSDAWAQPFLSSSGKVIYCGNGALGKFPKPDYRAYYNKSIAEGKHFPSSIDHPASTYPVMDDGCCLHSSEIMSNVVADYYELGNSLRHALNLACSQYPSEVAVLALAEGENESVSALRLNQSLHWGRREGEYYLATSAFAFDKLGISDVNLVPRSTALTMYRDHLEMEPVDSFNCRFAPSPCWSAVTRKIDELFNAGGDFSVAELSDSIAPMWKGDLLDESIMTTYDYLRENVRNGFLEARIVPTKGSGAGLIAPQKRFRKAQQ